MSRIDVHRYIRSIRPGQRPVRTLIEVDGRDLELFFATEILGLRSLHYGYWDAPPEGEPTLASFKEAQARFTDRRLRTCRQECKPSSMSAQASETMRGHL